MSRYCDGVADCGDGKQNSKIIGFFPVGIHQEFHRNSLKQKAWANYCIAISRYCDGVADCGDSNSTLGLAICKFDRNSLRNSYF